jgi:hypothetical protein
MNRGATYVRIGLYAFPLSFIVHGHIHPGPTCHFACKFFAGKHNSGVETKDSMMQSGFHCIAADKHSLSRHTET